MTGVWEVRLKDYDGVPVGLITEYAGFTFTKRVNTAGAWALGFGQRADETEAAFIARCDAWEYDGQAELWYADATAGITNYREYEGLIRYKGWQVTEGGALICEVGGRGYNDLLNRRIIWATAGSAGGTKAGVAETVMKAWVNEQAGPGASAVRAIPGLSIEADVARGNVVTMGRSWRNLLEVLCEVADIGGGDFAVVGTGAATWEFRWQPRVDKSGTVQFALAWGNMGQPSLRRARQDEVNYVLVGGQGEKAGRILYHQGAPMPAGYTPRDRIEQFADGRNEAPTSLDALISIADGRLDAGMPEDKLSFRVLETPTTIYGRDYTVGNIARATFLDYDALKQITAVTVTASANQRRTVEMETVDV